MAEKGGEAPARIFCTKYETKQCLVKKVVQVAWIESGGGRKFGPEDNIFAGGDPLGFFDWTSFNLSYAQCPTKNLFKHVHE